MNPFFSHIFGVRDGQRVKALPIEQRFSSVATGFDRVTAIVAGMEYAAGGYGLYELIATPLRTTWPSSGYFVLQFQDINDGPATVALGVGDTTPRQLLTSAGAALSAGAILADDIAVVRYNGTDCRILGKGRTLRDALRFLDADAGVGYSAAGGSVVQAASKAGGVTLNTTSGTVTMNAASLAAGAVASFTLTNSKIAATDVVDACIAGGATAGAYLAQVDQVAAGSCRISLRNLSAGALAEAVAINFAVMKAVNA